MPKITPSKRKGAGDRDVVYAKTKPDASKSPTQMWKWWNAANKGELAKQVIETAAYLKTNQEYRFRQASTFARLYGNLPLYNFIGTSINKMSQGTGLPIDRPTMNVVNSCVDTLVSRITQSRPRPIFLTDNSDYKERNLAKQMNNFIMGEFYQTKAHDLGQRIFRDACVFGTGCVKVFENADKRVGVDRTLLTSLYVDPNEAFQGAPRQMHQLALMDRGVAQDVFPGEKSIINGAEQAYPDAGGESMKTVSDQIMVCESWHLPSGPDAKDGLHVISSTAGVLFEESYDKKIFPFCNLMYSEPLVGYWGQGLAELTMGTQVEINKLLITISQAINIVGVPRIFVEDGSKIVKAQINNAIGSIVTYRGTPPEFVVAPCVPQELYAQLERLVQYAYQQAGISAMSAIAQKPQGLDSGEAIRSYDDIQSDRFATVSKRYDNWFVDLAYLVIDKAKEIAVRDGKYATVYPNKDGAKEIDLPKATLLEDPYVIQCFDASSLPRDPAGRLQKVTEMAQSGMITMQEARRLLDYPDLEQVNKLANAAEERIYQMLDDIVESGSYEPPEPFIDLQLANTIVVQYINMFATKKLEESKMQKLRDWFTQIQDLMKAAMPPPPPQGMLPNPQAVPEAPQSSPLLPNAPASPQA